MKKFILCSIAILYIQTGHAQSINSDERLIESTLSGGGIGLLVGGPPGMIFGSFIGALLSENNTIKNSLNQKNHEYQSSIDSYKREINELNSALKEKKPSSIDTQKAKHESQQISLVLLYRSNHYIIEPEYLNSLSSILNLLKGKKEISIDILSFADARGSNSENLTLSESRSSFLKDHLIRNGIPAEAINDLAYGEIQSRSIEQDPTGLMFDRRIELTINYKH
jgi:outer membrane protein OmpA-like peptidoglycan-associated protein